MSDLSHVWSNDLTAGPTGDLATVTGPDLTPQRIRRRLLTNPGDYIWQPTYGAGLGRFVGLPDAAAQIEAVTLRQMRLEAGVAQSPPPVVTIATTTAGQVFLTVVYTDAATGTSQTLTGTL